MAAFAIRGDVAVIEAAQACGAQPAARGPPPPLTATSYGVGELVGAAADAGARHIVLGLGGSATTDGGAGLIAALGGRILAADGGPVASGGAALAGLRELDPTGLRDLSGVDVLLASDVDIPCSAPTGQRRSTARRRARPRRIFRSWRRAWRGGPTWPRRRWVRASGTGRARAR